MLTDLQGYSERSADSSRTDLVQLVQTHNNLIRPIIDFFRGKVVKTMGDAFLCIFESATDAASCALAIQHILSEYNKAQVDPHKHLHIRIIINSGDVTLDKDDIYGEPVNIVARMEKLPDFNEGGIGISESTYLLMNRKEIQADFIGEHTFKGVSNPIKVYRLLLDKQKLNQLPDNLNELINQVLKGKSGLRLSSNGHKKSSNALLYAAFLCGIGGIYFVWQTFFKGKSNDGIIFTLDKKSFALSNQETKVLSWKSERKDYVFTQSEDVHQPLLSMISTKKIALSFQGFEWMDASFLVDFLKKNESFTLFISALVKPPLSGFKSGYLVSCHDGSRQQDIFRLGISRSSVLEFWTANKNRVTLAPLEEGKEVKIYSIRYDSKGLHAWINTQAVLRNENVQIPLLRTAFCSLGQEYDGSQTTDYFVGTLYGFRVYPRALDEDEIHSNVYEMAKDLKN